MPAILKSNMTALVSLFLLLSLGCGDISSPSGQTSWEQEWRDCPPAHDNVWGANYVVVTVTKPPCPITIKSADAFIDYAAVLTGPNSTFDLTFTPLTYFDVWSTDHGYLHRQSPVFWFAPDVNVANQQRAEPSATGQPGLYAEPGFPDRYRDSIHITVEQVKNNFFLAQAWKILPGRITAQAQTVQGPTQRDPLQSGIWTAKTHWDASGYSFAWILDGATVSGANGSTLSWTFNVLGSHELKSIVIRADNTTDTVTKTISVPFKVTVTGPTSVEPYISYTWNRSIPVGHPPYTYQWYIDGNPAGTGSSLTKTFYDPASMHSIRVRVWDSDGHTGISAGEYYVNVTTGSCPPEDEECNESQRVPDRPPLRLMPPDSGHQVPPGNLLPRP